jgi:hypothetical protein
MEMIGQNGKTEDIYPKPASQFPQACFEPNLAVIEVLTGKRVVTTQKAMTYAPIDAMKNRNFVRIKDLGPG